MKRERSRPPHPGEAERIAARRAKAFQLRVSGANYQRIAQQLKVSLNTAWEDVNAELFELRRQTKADAEHVRALELQRCDELMLGLWPQARRGHVHAVQAAIRVMERRAKLLGLDTQKDEFSVPVQQVLAYTHRMKALVQDTVTDKDAIARFLAGLDRLMGRTQDLDALAVPSTDAGPDR